MFLLFSSNNLDDLPASDFTNQDKYYGRFDAFLEKQTNYNMAQAAKEKSFASFLEHMHNMGFSDFAMDNPSVPFVLDLIKKDPQLRFSILYSFGSQAHDLSLTLTPDDIYRFLNIIQNTSNEAAQNLITMTYAFYYQSSNHPPKGGYKVSFDMQGIIKIFNTLANIKVGRRKRVFEININWMPNPIFRDTIFDANTIVQMLQNSDCMILPGTNDDKEMSLGYNSSDDD